jgi:hypothetical protein
MILTYMPLDLTYEYSDVEVPGSETRLRHINLQSAFVRLTVGGFTDMGFRCSLQYILPDDYRYPDLSTHKIGGPRRIGGDILAGAHWVLHPENATYVYEECQKKETVSMPREIWCKEHWRIWKHQLQWVIDDERFEDIVKEVAKQSLEMMQNTERNL